MPITEANPAIPKLLTLIEEYQTDSYNATTEEAEGLYDDILYDLRNLVEALK